MALTSRFVSKAQAALTTSSRAGDKRRMSLIYVSLAIVLVIIIICLESELLLIKIHHDHLVVFCSRSCSTEIFVFVAMSIILLLQ